MPAETVVITGGGGFVGRHLVAELEQAWPKADLIVWDTKLGAVLENVSAVTVDITDPVAVRSQLMIAKPTWVVHLAAIAAVPAAFNDPELVERVNVGGTRVLLEALRDVVPTARVLVVSTSDIYGQGSVDPLVELSLKEADPRNPYAKSKWEMERLIEEEFSDRVIRVRPFPHLGPGQGLGFVTADFASQIAAIEVGRQQPVLQVGTLETQRDFTDVRDVVRAYRLLMERGVFGEACVEAERERGVCGVYHVASGRAVSIQGLLDGLLRLTDVAIEVKHDPARRRPVDVSVLVGDARKLQEATDWEMRVPLEQSLVDTLEWWRAKENS